MGIIYSEIKNHDLALKHFQGGLEIHEKINYGSGIASGLGNIGNVFFNKKNYEKALEYYQKALQKNKEIENNQGISREYGNIASVYVELNELQKAFEFQQKALKINEKINNNKGIAVNLQGIGKYHLAMANYDEALTYLKRANASAKSINIQDVQRESYNDISTVFERKGSVDSAYFYFKKYINIKENIDNEANRKQISRLEIQYEFDTKEEQYKTQQIISNQELVQQQLLNQLGNSKLRESNKEKDLVRLNYSKTQSELKSEKIEKREQRKLLIIVEKDNLLKQNEIKLNSIALKAKEKQKWFLISGLFLLGIIGGLLLYQNKNRKRSNQQLQILNNNLDQANKTKVQVLNILNHDLRSPVSSFIHFIQFQKENPKALNEETKSRIENATLYSAKNLLHVMEDILIWTKDQMENFEPQFKNVKVKTLFNDSKKYFIKDDDILLIFENPDNLEIISDENYLKTIIRNLSGNAIKALASFVPKHTNDSPSIKWKAYQENNKTILSITDNGCGVSEENLKVLFDQKGVVGIQSGLGLHLIRDLAKAINCTIEVQSVLNQGTTFKIIF